MLRLKRVSRASPPPPAAALDLRDRRFNDWAWAKFLVVFTSYQSSTEFYVSCVAKQTVKTNKLRNK